MVLGKHRGGFVFGQTTRLRFRRVVLVQNKQRVVTYIDGVVVVELSSSLRVHV